MSVRTDDPSLFTIHPAYRLGRRNICGAISQLIPYKELATPPSFHFFKLRLTSTTQTSRNLSVCQHTISTTAEEEVINKVVVTVINKVVVTASNNKAVMVSSKEDILNTKVKVVSNHLNMADTLLNQIIRSNNISSMVDILHSQTIRNSNTTNNPTEAEAIKTNLNTLPNHNMAVPHPHIPQLQDMAHITILHIPADPDLHTRAANPVNPATIKTS
jgi:hypothetical protein